MNRLEERRRTVRAFVAGGVSNWCAGRAAGRLAVIERQLRRIHEQDCSEPADDLRARREAKLVFEVRAIAAKLAPAVVGMRINGDPRGPAIRLLLASGRSNNWDGETWAILH